MSSKTLEYHSWSRSEPSIQTFWQLFRATSCATSWMYPDSWWQRVPELAELCDDQQTVFGIVIQATEKLGRARAVTRETLDTPAATRRSCPTSGRSSPTLAAAAASLDGTHCAHWRLEPPVRLPVAPRGATHRLLGAPCWLEASRRNAVGCSRARQRKHAESCLAQESRHILRCQRKKCCPLG